MPDYESLSEVYQRLGWQVLPNGRSVGPDPYKLAKRRRKSREKKRAALCQHGKALCPHGKALCPHQKLASTAGGLAHSASEPSLADCSKKAEHKAKTPAPSLQGKKILQATKGHGKQKAQLGAPKAGSTLGQGTLLRTRPLRPGQQEAPSAPVRAARHHVRPETALVHAVMRRSASAPGFAFNTAKRAAERETMRQTVA